MRVLHFIRKNSQLKASFIFNQITNHIEFEAFISYRKKIEKKYDGGFVNLKNFSFPTLDLSEDENFYEKFIYKFNKSLSKRQKKLLIQFITKNKIDIIHLHYATDAFIFLPSLKNINIPKVVSVYGYDSSGFPKRFLGLGKWLLKNRTFRYATKVLAMSPDMKKDLILAGCPEDKIIVHYYGTDVKKFYQQHNYNNTKNCKFLIISGLTPQKGHIFLLKAFQNALQKNQNITLTIAGEGPEKQKILSYIKEKKLEHKVTYIGSVIYGSAEHLDLFAKHDVFVHPSVTDVNGDKEGIPGAVVEAMASGLPVISTYHAGIPYIIENEKTGLLVNENDVEALKNAILKLAESPILREKLGIAGQKYALDNLDLFNKEIELEKIYKEVIENNG